MVSSCVLCSPCDAGPLYSLFDSEMKKLGKFLKWPAIILLGGPVYLYLVWVAGNLSNDELKPEVAALMQQRPPQLNERDNAYFDTIGLAAPAGMEPHAWGVAWFTQASANDRAVLENKPATPIKLAGIPLDGERIELPCAKKDANYTCLEEIALDTAAAKRHLEREATLLQRFDALLDKDYQEPYREMSFMSEIAPRAPELRASKLAQIRIALEFTQGHDDAALSRWKRETLFVLRQARNSHTLIDAMLFTSALNRYQRLLADYLSTHAKAARARTKQLLAMLEPFDKSAVTLQPALESEAAFATRSLLSQQMTLGAGMEDEPSVARKIAELLATPLFDKQATANDLASKSIEYANIAALQGDAHRAGVAKMTAVQNQAGGDLLVFHYHNPVGKIILAIAGSTDYSAYLYKSDDILANKKLLAFAIDLLSRDATSSKQVIDAINTRQADLKHPYTGEAPHWDAEKRTLSYSMPEQSKGSSYAPLVIRL